MNKTESARNAGYKFPNSRVTNIEKTNNFREITSQILADNSSNVVFMIAQVREALERGEFAKYPLNERIKMITDLTNIQKNLSPDLRIKETIDDKGKITRTMWNTASPMQAQALTSEQKPLETKEETNVAQYAFSDTESTLINNDIADTTPTDTA